MSPESGSIRPRESMLCKVVIEAVGKPTYYDVDVVCEVRQRLSSTTCTHSPFFSCCC